MTRDSTIPEGVLVGLTGACAVAIWFFLYDLATGQPLRTPALLGSALFLGLRDPGAVHVTAGGVLKYTMVHGVAFIGFGLVMAGLFRLADRERTALFAAFMLLCCFEVFFIAMVLMFAERLVEDIPVWSIATGNLIATVCMLGILFRRHHRMPSEVLSAGE